MENWNLAGIAGEKTGVVVRIISRHAMPAVHHLEFRLRREASPRENRKRPTDGRTEQIFRLRMQKFRDVPKETLTIPFRFRGPPRSGNGGYVSGILAELFDANAPVEVTLRAPAPLDKPLELERGDGIRIVRGETLIAEAQRVDVATDLELVVPAPPTYEESKAAQPASPSFFSGDHALVPPGSGFHPVCFCCGTENRDGMKVYAAPVGDGSLVAAAWPTKASWGDAKAQLPARLLWTALDCPGQFAYLIAGTRTGPLGRVTAHVKRPAPAGERYVATGWRIAVKRKKHFAGTAIFASDGELVAVAKSIWIGDVGAPRAGDSSIARP